MAVSVNVSETINEMLTQSPDLKLKQLAALKPNLKYNAVKTAYYRWQRIHNPKPKKKKGRKVSKKMKTKETSKKSEETTDVNPLLSPELTFDYLKFIWQQKSINNSKLSDAMLKMGIDLIDKEYKYKKKATLLVALNLTYSHKD